VERFVDVAAAVERVVVAAVKRIAAVVADAAERVVDVAAVVERVVDAVDAAAAVERVAAAAVAAVRKFPTHFVAFVRPVTSQPEKCCRSPARSGTRAERRQQLE
jgi:hypothetical protein